MKPDSCAIKASNIIKFIIAAAVVILTMALPACRRDNDAEARLDAAERLMESHPDSALVILEQLDRRSLDKSELPYYALLMTQAMVKTDVPVDSDTLISLAYRKYADNRRGDRGIRSSFYMGEVFFNQEKSREAMKHYLKAYEEAKRLDNHYWRAKSAERIADLFFLAFNYDEASRYRKEAIEHYGLADRIANQRYAIADLATIYMNDNNQSEALSLLDSLLLICNQEVNCDSCLTAYIEDARLRTMFCIDKTIALQNYDTLCLNNTQNDRDKLEDLIMISMANSDELLNCRNDSILNQAQYYLSTEEDSLQLLYARYMYCDFSNNKDLKLAIADSLLIMQEKLTRKVLKESVTATQSDFYATAAYQQKKTSQHLRIIAIMTALLLGVTIIYGWRLFVLKSRQHRKDIEEIMDSMASLMTETKKLSTENEELSSQITDHNTHIDHLTHLIDEKDGLVEGLKYKVRENERIVSGLEKRLEYYQNGNLIHEMQSLFKDRWNTLNMLCDEYYELGDSAAGRNQIIKKIERELKNLCSNNSLKHIETQINRYSDDIMLRLRQQCGLLKEKDFTFLMLIYAGFSVRTICLFTDIKYGSFYVRKNRLIKKISESNAPDKDEFLTGLN